MELVKDVYFNTDKLVENTKVKVSYTGEFYQGNNEKVFLHYGYGKDWNNVNEVEMKKTDLGYQTELDLVGCDTINFCFKNQNDEWDNNCGKNYVFNIEKAPINNYGKITVGTKETSSVFGGETFNQPTNEPNQYIGTNVTTTNNVVGGFNQVPNTEVKPNCVAPSSFKKVEITGTPNNLNTIGSVSTNGIKSTPTNIVNPVQNCKETAIALAPTGFNYWTKKIKETVCKFFAYVPKLISGNYKRKIIEE